MREYETEARVADEMSDVAVWGASSQGRDQRLMVVSSLPVKSDALVFLQNATCDREEEEEEEWLW